MSHAVHNHSKKPYVKSSCDFYIKEAKSLTHENDLLKTQVDMYRHAYEVAEEQNQWNRWGLIFAIVLSFSVGFYVGCVQ